MVSENILLDIKIRLEGVALLASTTRSITNLLRTNTAHFIVGIMPFYGLGSVYRSMLYFRRGLHAMLITIIFKQTAEGKSGIPVHNQQKMQPSKFKFRMKFHIL